MTKVVPIHYVNNKEFTQAIIEHNQSVKEAIAKDKTPPRVTEYIGECIYKIATRLSTRPNFINYTYRDEMICDGIENTLQYINNFNSEKSSNAFAYVTQICYYAFLRRIQKEKKQSKIKQKQIENAGVDFATYATIDGVEDPAFVNAAVEWMKENMLSEDTAYDTRKAKKEKKGKLDKFVDEDSNS